MANAKQSLVEFTVDHLDQFQFKNAEQVASAIRGEYIAIQYCSYTGEPVIINNIQKLAEEVFERLPERAKI